MAPVAVTDHVASVVARCRLLRDLSPAARQAIIAAGRRHSRPRDAYFFHQGEAATTMYILIAGQVKLSQVTPEGDQIIINYLGAGDGLGIIVALSEMPYPLSATAIEPTEALAWDRSRMRDLMLAHPQLALNALDMVGGRFAHLQARFGELATKQVTQRVARGLLRLLGQFGRRTEAGIELDLAVTREDLAQMTGTNLYTVSRLLSQWEQDGILATKRQHITLFKPHELVVIGEDLPPPTDEPAG